MGQRHENRDNPRTVAVDTFIRERLTRDNHRRRWDLERWSYEEEQRFAKGRPQAISMGRATRHTK